MEINIKEINLENGICFNLTKEKLKLTIVRTTNECPYGRNSCKEFVHWRTGVHFEHMKRCGKHNISWEPNTDVMLTEKI